MHPNQSRSSLVKPIVVGIIVIVVGGIILAYFTSGNKKPERPGLTTFVSSSGVIKLDYPSFLESAKESHDNTVEIGMHGMKASEKSYLRKLEHQMTGNKSIMIVTVVPDDHANRSLIDDKLSGFTEGLSGVTEVFTKSQETCDHEPGQSCIHLEKVFRAFVIGPTGHVIFRKKTSDGFIMFAIALVDARSRQDYQKEIKASFESIIFFPSVARRIYESQKAQE